MKIQRTHLNKFLIFAITIIFIFGIETLNAAMLKDVPTTITQPDGKVLNCWVSGDEYYRRFHDKDGYTIIKNTTTKWYVYAVNSGDELHPTELIYGESDPSEAGLQKGAMINPEIIKEKRREYKSFEIKPDVKQKVSTQVNNTGVIRNIVIYIRFSGESEFTDDTSTYHNMFNANPGNSMYTYFVEASYNNLSIYSSFYPRPSGTIVKSFQDSHTRNYYQPYDADDNPTGYQNSTQQRTREHTLLKDAVEGVRSEIPTGLVIDNDNDGFIDNVCFIVSGSNGSWSDLLWPHKWSLSTFNVTINGKRVWDYNFQLQNFIKVYGNSVLAHEMFHTLGAPDLYHYSQDAFNPVDKWDIMATTTTVPQHMGAWMKYTYGGWISNLPEITTGGSYSLNPLTSPTNNCYKIASPNSTTEIFLVEYRKKNSTYESGLPGSGLIVYRIKPSLAPNGNADGPPDEVYVYRPGGTPSQNGNPNNAFFTSDVGRTEINDNTDPSCFLINGSAGGIMISNVGAAGNTIAFNVFLGALPPTLVYPSNLAGSIPVNVTLKWNRVSMANSYNVQVSTNQNFTGIVFNQSVITDTTVTVSPNLNYGSTYYWRVNAVTSSTGPWSNVSSFNTMLDKPVLTVPVNNEYAVVLRDTLNWLPVNGADFYTVEMDNNGSFTSPFFHLSNIGNNYLIIPNSTLENNTMYYWRVKASKTTPSTESDWSDVRNFTTILSTPVLLTPKNDSLGTGFDGALNWQSVNGATMYNVQLSKKSDFSTTIIDQSGVTGTNSVFEDLDYNTRYFWRIKAVNSFQSGLWSSPFNFTTKLKSPDLTDPDNGSGSVQIDAPLVWDPVDGGHNYFVQVASDSNMNDIIIDEAEIDDPLFTCSGLDSKTQYFWRVKAHNNDGRTSDWSVKWSFITVLGIPKTPSPADNAENVDVEGMLVWNEVNGADKYHVQLSKNSNLTNLIFNDSNISATSVGYPVLEPATTYYWKIRAFSSNNSGNWSPIWKFTTGIGIVQLSSPNKDSKGVPVDGTLKWNTMPGADTYAVQLSSEPDFSVKVVDQSGLTATQVPYSNLQANMLYYWRVNSSNESGTGDWSDVWNFITSAGEPGLLAPNNNKGGMGLSDTLIWLAAPGAQSYSIEIATDDKMTEIVKQQSGITVTSYIYTGFKNYTNYFWRVNSSNSDGVSAWSEVRKFTTIINSPELFSPDEDVKDAPVDGTFEWNPVQGANSYTLFVSVKQDFGVKVIMQEGINDIKFDYSGFQNNKIYYWKVLAENSDKNSEWSSTRKMLTVLGQTKLNSPADSAVQVPISGKLTWQTVDGVKSYRLQLAETNNFTTVLVDTSNIMFTYYDYNGLLENKSYFWKVNAVNANSTGEWSEIWSFFTNNPNPVEDQLTNDISFNAYPNPFSTELNFEVNLKNNLNSSIDIYNQTGIKTGHFDLKGLTNNPAIIKWQPEGLPNGIYNVILKSGNDIKSVKIILLN